MKKRRYTEEQIAFALRQAESGTPVPEIIRQIGISEPTFYRWRKKYAGLGIAIVCVLLVGIGVAMYLALVIRERKD